MLYAKVSTGIFMVTSKRSTVRSIEAPGNRRLWYVLNVRHSCFLSAGRPNMLYLWRAFDTSGSKLLPMPFYILACGTKPDGGLRHLSNDSSLVLSQYTSWATLS